MRRPKFFISVIVFIFTFSHPAVYSQEVSEEKIPYVKPGHVTLNFKDADIRAVLNYLSEVSGVDIVPSPEVTGRITLKLTNKPWKTALDIIVKSYGYVYEREEDVIRVVTLSSLKLEELSTEVIFLNYAKAKETQEGIRDMLTERGKLRYDPRINALVVTDLPTNINKIKQVIEVLKVEELSTEVIFLNYAKAKETQEGIRDMLTERGKLRYDPRINALVVTDLPTNINKIKQVIGVLKLEELSTEVIFLNYAKAEEAQAGIRDMLSERGKLKYDPRINVLVITDLPTNINKIKQVIGALDRKTPQIMIEAKIIETTLDKTERLGIDWNLAVSIAGARRPTTIPFVAFQPDWGLHSKVVPKFFPVGTTGTETVTTPSGDVTQVTGAAGDFPISDTIADYATHAFPFVGTDAFTYGTLDFTQFSLLLEYLKSRSDTNIISNPRITTLNNRRATMFVGRVHPYISRVDEDEEAGTVKYDYGEKEIGIRLEVTPYINENGDIEVKLKPEIKDIVGYQQLTEYFSLPIFSTREAETQVMVRDGDTVFLGGMIRENIREYTKKFPILGDLFGGIPLIGSVFKYKTESKTKTELVFFLTVHLVKDLKELTRIATEEISEIYIPLDTGGGLTEPLPEELPEKVARQILSPVPKKRKPLFDFRKKKK